MIIQLFGSQKLINSSTVNKNYTLNHKNIALKFYMSEYIKAEKTEVDHIIQLLSAIYPVSNELAEVFYENAISIQVEKDNHILKQGEFCKYMYFIKKGAMMAYSSHNHQQITTFISVENEFLSSLSGLYGEAPSKESIIAIEPTYLLGVNTDILLGWYERFFDLNYIIRRVYESYYKDAQERSHMVRVGDAKERYQYFVNSRTSDVDRLPIECVASFLNMKPETLIRVKKQLGKEIKPNELENIKQIFERYIIENEAFKINDISVKKISKEIKISSDKISYLLTHHYKKSFKDFINKYRIDYFKQLIKEENNLQNYTVATIALQAGFSSKSIFYKVFKDQEGVSPKDFINISET